MESNPLLSVVIPIYNVGPYIETCVRSLFNQTLKNIEFIFVDDASTDNSIEILNKLINEYKDKNLNIKIIKHEKNLGLVRSRKDGIKVATGEWLIHCDSDDYLETNAYELVVNKAIEENDDILVFAYYLNENNNLYIKKQDKGFISNEDLLKAISDNSTHTMGGYLWNKLFKRRLWEQISVPDSIVYCEDIVALYLILLSNKNLKIQIIEEPLYNYRIRENSLITKRNQKRQEEIINLINLFKEIKSHNSEEIGKIIDVKTVSLLYRLLETNYDINRLAQNYEEYKKVVPYNRALNTMEKLQLKISLSNHKRLGNLIQILNHKGRKFIKKLKRIR